MANKQSFTYDSILNLSRQNGCSTETVSKKGCYPLYMTVF